MHVSLQGNPGKRRQPIDFDREWSKKFGSAENTSASVTPSAQRTASRSSDAAADVDEQQGMHHDSLAVDEQQDLHHDSLAVDEQQDLHHDSLAVESRLECEPSFKAHCLSSDVRTENRRRDVAAIAQSYQAHMQEGRTAVAAEQASGSRRRPQAALQGKRSHAAPLVHAVPQVVDEHNGWPGAESTAPFSGTPVANVQYQRPGEDCSVEDMRSPSPLTTGEEASAADQQDGSPGCKATSPSPPPRLRQDISGELDMEPDASARRVQKRSARNEVPRSQKRAKEPQPKAVHLLGRRQHGSTQHPPTVSNDSRLSLRHPEREATPSQLKRSKGSAVSERARRVEAALARSSPTVHAARCAFACLSLPNPRLAAASHVPAALMCQ
jgi:hypothetical protein